MIKPHRSRFHCILYIEKNPIKRISWLIERIFDRCNEEVNLEIEPSLSYVDDKFIRPEICLPVYPNKDFVWLDGFLSVSSPFVLKCQEYRVMLKKKKKYTCVRMWCNNRKIVAECETNQSRETRRHLALRFTAILLREWPDRVYSSVFSERRRVRAAKAVKATEKLVTRGNWVVYRRDQAEIRIEGKRHARRLFPDRRGVISRQVARFIFTVGAIKFARSRAVALRKRESRHLRAI